MSSFASLEVRDARGAKVTDGKSPKPWSVYLSPAANGDMLKKAQPKLVKQNRAKERGL